jgi:hypothetical protein
MTLGIIAVIILAALAVFTYIRILRNEVILNIGLALVAALILWLLQREYLRSHNIFIRLRLAKVIGGVAALEHVSVVYPAFEIDPELLAAVPFTHREYRYVKRRPIYGYKRADVPVVAAENDVRAMIAISNLVADHGLASVSVHMDGDFVSSDIKGSFISFGLSSNECTHHYLAGCELIGEQPLFSIFEEQDEEIIRLFDGTELRVENTKGFIRHPGVFVKYTPKTENPDICWIFVLGMGAPATPGICYWLQDNWSDLSRLATATGTSQFIAVFYTDSFADSSTRLSRFIPVGPVRPITKAIASRPANRRLLDKYVKI